MAQQQALEQKLVKYLEKGDAHSKIIEAATDKKESHGLGLADG